MKPILTLEHLSKYFPLGKHQILTAVKDVSLSIFSGETFAIVGESGCGKTTLGRLIMGIYEPDEGKVLFQGKLQPLKTAADRAAYAKELQMIFQNPYSSLNPRMTIASIIAEGMEIQQMLTAEERKNRVFQLLKTVGLEASHAGRFPHEFSGGQLQRISIARALAPSPSLLICDEPLSALDVSIQSQIVNLLTDIQKEMNLTYLLISHDLNIVKYMAHRIGVMYLGHMVELADCDTLFSKPIHPYTRILLGSVLSPEPSIEKHSIPEVTGEVPSPINQGPGCPFASRCPMADNLCLTTMPPLVEGSLAHFAACHHSDFSNP